MVSHQDFDVVIAGGGIAGLCAAIAVLSLGKSVAVYERSAADTQRSEGAGIVVGDDLQRFMSLFNVTSTAWTVKSDLRQTLDRSGRQIDVESRIQHLSSWKILYALLRSKADSLARNKRYYFDGVAVTGFRKVENSGIQINLETSAHKRIDTVSAKMLLAADGANSLIRQTLAPETRPQPAGYIAWRGMVPENELSAATRESLLGRLTFFHTAGSQMVVYPIPSSVDTLSNRYLNFVWYCNCPHMSYRYKTIMTDVNDVVRHITMPVGLLKPEIWSEEIGLAHKILPPSLAELVVKTKLPFAQGITDVLSPEAFWLDGKVILIGDALAGFRPHTGAGTNQAAFHALCLWDWFKLSREDRKTACKFRQEVMTYADGMINMGRQLGLECQTPINVEFGP